MKPMTHVMIISMLILVFYVEARVTAEESTRGALVDAVLDRVFPLHNDAVSWKAVNWSDYNKIIISGPQRSGTTFFAQALAKNLGYKHSGEEEEHIVRSTAITTATAAEERANFMVTGRSALDEVLRFPGNVVMQRPRWSDLLHDLPAFPADKGVFIVFLGRNCLDVFRSQNRIMTNAHNNSISNTGWTCAYGRKAEWAHYNKRPELRDVVDSMHDMICTIKQQAFLRYQAPVLRTKGISHAVIAYDSLETFPGYVEQTARGNLKPKQIAVPVPN